MFIQNYRPGVAERLGIGEEAVRAVSPKIVYVSISGFGEKGPLAQKPVYDPIIQGFTGLATVQAGSDEERPRMLRTILPDKLTAITSSQAITAALQAGARMGYTEATGRPSLRNRIAAHYRDWGQAFKETVETGSRGALAGGITTICDMPNTSPNVNTVETIKTP